MDHLEEEIEIEAIGVEVSTQPVELYKVLKIADAVGGGGEAKQAISQGFVAVNGEIETRKRRKLVDGDLVQFDEEFYLVIYVDPADAPEVEYVDNNYDAGDQGYDEPLEYVDAQQFESPTQETTASSAEDDDTSVSPRTGRKSIDFF
ncbi:RNA-binding S4 domain-containing protein [Vibrio rarus]|uniref:RNA-binding S4 domain-containing protein n=1 Tax=Vibrio rarus TaxID=413403 RepID=UPI0021C2A603|nr:RNA-binding S4 domain-containing protein [Vibrio rarus]